MATSLLSTYGTTQSISRTDLVGLTSVSFIRPQRISFSVSGTKPNTRLYAFFDGQVVSQYVAQTGKNKGDPIIADSAGSVTGYFDVPPVTFNTGVRTFLLQDDPVYSTTVIPGNSVGTAQANFSAAGILKTFQQTTDVTNTTFNTFKQDITKTVTNNIIAAKPVPPPAPAPVVSTWSGGNDGGGGGGDPLAQTFFTYGVKGGCFITAISVFFQSKDASLPITLQIRNTNNGYPTDSLISEYASKTLSPVSIFTSNDSSLETKFAFDRPIYLQENQEFCFVLMANSNGYNVWTSEFSKVSVETGKTIFEQPYVGTMFKSENNSTWTAEQAEDIKFTIYRASFNTAPREYTFKANAPTILVPGYNFSTTSGVSPIITASFDTQHGHKTGDKIVLATLTGATYRGMTAATLGVNTGFSVTVIDDYSLTFTATGCTSTSAGLLSASGILNQISVIAPGTGYTASPSIVVSGGGASVQATAHAVVVSGKVASVIIDTVGTGYTSKPSVAITDGSGSGCILDAVSEAIFVVSLNKQYQNLLPVVDTFIPQSTTVDCTIKTMTSDYIQGIHELSSLTVPRQLVKNAVLLNSGTETVVSSGVNSTEIKMTFSTDNANVSPMLDLANKPRLRVHNFIVNNSSNAASETSATTGTAQSKYISKIVKIDTPSKGAKIFVSGASIKQTSFDVFIRTSIGSDNHTLLAWTPMNCDILRNVSSTWDEYRDYEFYIENLAIFDTYDIKIVLYSDVKYLFPKIDNYRVIILAS
jgi:hypothetical protein